MKKNHLKVSNFLRILIIAFADQMYLFHKRNKNFRVSIKYFNQNF